MQRQQIRSSNQVGWADTVNNNATFTDAWQKTEYGEFLLSDLDLAYANGQCVIESITVTGAAGTQPAIGDEQKVEILISDSSTFTQNSCVAIATGHYSNGLIDTDKRLCTFQIKQPIVLSSTNGSIYFTVKCPGSDTLTADKAVIVVSQS